MSFTSGDSQWPAENIVYYDIEALQMQNADQSSKGKVKPDVPTNSSFQISGAARSRDRPSREIYYIEAGYVECKGHLGSLDP
jgi:hypothetical protein